MSLEIKNVHFQYADKVVVDDVTLSVGIAEIHGIVGINGAGKTTLMNLICGLLKPAKGTICWKGNFIKNTDVAYLESNLYSYPWMTAGDYLDLFSINNFTFNLDKWNRIFQLPLREYISNFSSGMQKKLGLLGIIALDRPLLLLDEPFNTLDMESVELLKKLLLSLRDSGKTILLSSHIIETLTATCNQIHYMDNGVMKYTFPESHFGELRNEIMKFMEMKYEEKISDAVQGKNQEETFSSIKNRRSFN